MTLKNLAVGNYVVTWSNPDFETLSAEIEVTKFGVSCIKVTGGVCGATGPGSVNISGAWSVFGTLKPVAIPPPTPEGYISVTSSPANASVDVNGTNIGKTPVTGYGLTTGSKLVTIRLSGYNPEERSVTIVAGETATVDATLTPIPAGEGGFIFVTSTPSGANVSIDGVSIGSTPIDNYGLPAGSKTVTIALDGYETATRAVTIVAGETATVDVTLVESAVPTTIGGWIDEVSVSALTRDHALYVYYLSTGATGAAEALYGSLSPKPSAIDALLATRDNGLGIYYYSIGAMGAGNTLTGCSY